jgi:hypothetical protein
MTRIAASILIVLALLTSTARAQSNDDPNQRVALAERIVERTWPDTRRAIEVMRDQIAATLPVEQRESFRTMLNDHFDYESYKQLKVEMTARHFTVPELTALDNFYASPEGQSVMQKMPQVLSEMIPFAQRMIIEAIRRTPAEQRPPKFRDL